MQLCKNIIKMNNKLFNRSIYLLKPLKQLNHWNINKRFSSSLVRQFYETCDKSQTQTFDERLILVDHFDNRVDSVTKIEGHLKQSNNKYPHRAFSVFLFSNDNKLMLQQRANKKITFPNLWSNTCCSHPLDIENEQIKKDNIGIKNAAIRRMKYELGMTTSFKDYFLYQKILYRADSDKIFEEFELDYILISKMHNINSEKSITELKVLMNPDEVSDIKFVSQEELHDDINKDRMKVTPWFKLIIENKLDEIFEILKTNIQLREENNIDIINYISKH
jgi:isopentenyl-diphosphate delta-isomerase